MSETYVTVLASSEAYFLCLKASYVKNFFCGNLKTPIKQVAMGCNKSHNVLSNPFYVLTLAAPVEFALIRRSLRFPMETNTQHPIIQKALLA